MQVALIFNLKPESYEPGSLASEYDDPTVVEAIKRAIEAEGHDVILIEADENSYLTLQQIRPDIVFNIAEGLRGESRESHIPAMLEMLGIPYTFAGVRSTAICLDKPTTQHYLRCKGIPIPRFTVYEGDPAVLEGMIFPVICKPAHEGSSMGVSGVINIPEDLRETAEALYRGYMQPIMVEQFLSGREFTVGVLEDPEPRVLGILEILYEDIEQKTYDNRVKYEISGDFMYRCPPHLDPELKMEIEDIALRTFKALDLRDVARVDMRLEDGRPYVFEVNPIPGLNPGIRGDRSDLMRIAETAGLSHAELVQKILISAIKRA